MLVLAFLSHFWPNHIWYLAKKGQSGPLAKTCLLPKNQILGTRSDTDKNNTKNFFFIKKRELLMRKVSKIGLKMATGYKKCIEDRWTVKNLLVSAKGQLSTDRYKCLLQKSEEENPITKYDEAKVRFLGPWVSGFRVPKPETLGSNLGFRVPNFG